MISQSSGPTLVKGNTVHGCGGEGILLYNHTENVTVEHNTVYDIARPGIYTSGAKDINIHNNLVYCTQSQRYSKWGGSCGPGIRISAEMASTAGYNSNINVYENMVAGTHTCFSIAEIWYPEHKPTNISVYNNTFMESTSTNGGNRALYIESAASSTTNVIQKNIIWQTNGTIADVPSNGATFSNNLWSKAPDYDVRTSSDPTYPSYTSLDIADYFQKTTGWTNLTAGAVKASDFKLRDTALYAFGLGAEGVVLSGDESLLPPILKVVSSNQ
jgi:parallel beta-helix repeat protein